MDIDRKRIAAVRALEALRLQWWRMVGASRRSATPLSLMAKADDMHGALMRRADALAGCTEASDEEAELKTIIDLIEAYEQKRWPLGKDPKVLGGKG